MFDLQPCTLAYLHVNCTMQVLAWCMRGLFEKPTVRARDEQRSWTRPVGIYSAARGLHRATEARAMEEKSMEKCTVPALADAEARATQREIEVRRARREKTNRRASGVMLTGRAARAGERGAHRGAGA